MVKTSVPMAAAVAETHSGVVFFLGDRAYKAKKAVDLGFLDFRTLAARRLACHREVELNRRLAPDVYLGVADVVGPDGEVCEHLVVMRRLPDDRRLSVLARDGVDLEAAVGEIADLMAAFHARAGCPVAAGEAAAVSSVTARWGQLVELARRHSSASSIGELDVVETRARRYLDGRGSLFEERVQAGRARDGHGDLLADDIFVLDDGVRILDCLDFDESLRCGDVLADVAFLAMDLEHLGRAEAAAKLLDHYRRRTDDDWPASLAHHYIAPRALVRAGVSFVRAGQGDAGAGARARSFLTLARRHLDAGTVRLVVVSGLPGTGKSTLGARVAERLEAVLLRSDDVRRAGADDDRYSAGAVDRTYGELLTQAAALLARGRNVVLDATCRAPSHRLAVEALARAEVAELTVLECRAPDVVADRRIEERQRAGSDPSEATVEVAAALRASWQPWDRATAIDTTAGIDASIAAAMRAVTRAEEQQHV